ncbi:hypothetical protein AQUCO_02600204v1 [Aquilegia coerulea]|uniref:RING-type domain-containing protein n=1 Tax=Aquilegia coerulea TaxID=218851 RepID=A0A2G5D7V3_AQUCA|nr:hypothetical protein AQUCO_02600204v1 [Aquilegia coerulea]PIA39593.1 hypothetical protein AQUCO_02600204v1 [Aquilegia coerulea]
MVISRRRGKSVAKLVQAVVAHSLLLSFTTLLVLKLDQSRFFSFSWWKVFSPLWLFHATVARGRFSLPAPSIPRDRHWAPCHAIAATPLLVAFELLLCIYLESTQAYGLAAVNLRIVFLPLLALEILILIDNFRMCRALVPGDEESMNDEAIWETLPHFWIAISMIFFVAATTFTLLKLCGDVNSLGWWDLFLNFGIAECFAFLVCTKWSNPMIHGKAQSNGASIYSMSIRSSDWNSSSVFASEMDSNQDGMCILQDVGGHIMKIPLIAFQVLLCMHLEGTPSNVRHIPLPVLFSPLFLLQGAGVLIAISRLVEKTVLLVRGGDGTGRYFTISSRVYDCFEFLQQGSRLLGWWSIDEVSREEQALLYSCGDFGYNTFCGYAPETVKKLPKKDLVEEVWRLQAALGEQTEVIKHTQQEYERLQNEKFLCQICFVGEITMVLLPCRHHILCSSCAEKCSKCPICRVSIEERMAVYDV